MIVSIGVSLSDDYEIKQQKCLICIKRNQSIRNHNNATNEFGHTKMLSAPTSHLQKMKIIQHFKVSNANIKIYYADSQIFAYSRRRALENIFAAKHATYRFTIFYKTVTSL